MSRIVRMTSDTPVSPESIERLKRLAEMPDSEIRTDLNSEWTEERFARARARRTARLQQVEEGKLQKAS
jgi:L-alanine-DL-glutamate epimerase-like enolase superfamily enzyme